MTIKYINIKQAVAALKVAAAGIEESYRGGVTCDGLTVADLNRRIDDALRVVLGRETFDALDDGPDEYDCNTANWEHSQTNDDDEVDDPETPKF